MPRRSNPFQNLSASIMAALHGTQFDVQESVLSTNSRTGAVRELDILVAHRKDPNQRLLVECRDHKRKQDVRWIDELEGKARRLGFNHVVAVSSSGFTGPAEREGRDRGIGTLHLREAEKLDWAGWKFGLERFGFTFHFHPIIRRIEFVVRGGFPREVPKDITRERVYLVDNKKRIKISLSDWISGFQADPATAEKFPKPPESDTIQHYDCTIPCDPWIGFAIEPEGAVFPLEKVVLSIDRINAEYEVPLRHYRAGDEKLHVGHLDVLGHPTRMVLHEREGGDKLQVMIEQLAHVGERQYGLDQARGDLVVNLDNGREPPRVFRRLCYVSPATATGAFCL